MDSREAEIEYCKAHGIDLPFDARFTATAVTVTYGTSAMKDLNLRILHSEPNYDHLLVLGVTPEKAPDEG